MTRSIIQRVEGVLLVMRNGRCGRMGYIATVSSGSVNRGKHNYTYSKDDMVDMSKSLS